MSTILCHDETHGNIAEVTNPTPDMLNNMGMEGYEEESAEAEAEADTFAAEGAAASGSRMISRGKAAKIGITLLAILAIIAGVVVLSPKKSNDGPPSAVSSSQQQAEPIAKATQIVTPTPAPTVKKPQNKEKSAKETKEPKPPKPAPISMPSTPFPTEEGSSTVSTETTGPPTLQPRESVRTLKGQGK